MKTITDIANRLREKDNVLILVHRFPDGDTLGSAYALCGALQQLGKRAAVKGSDPVPSKFRFMLDGIAEQSFEPDYIVAVDVANVSLLGSIGSIYADKTDLCIDHHETNQKYAKETFVNPNAAATAEIIFYLVQELIGGINVEIADCLFTGLCTDTGCFKFSNVTADTHRIAANLIECGCHSADINKRMFDTKTRVRMDIEKAVLESLDFHFDGLCAFVTLPCKLIDNVDEGEIDGISTLPRQIEGVAAGVTLRELKTGGYKISFRTGNGVNAAKLAGCFGGGGHAAAAGCTIIDTEQNVKKAILAETERTLKECGLL